MNKIYNIKEVSELFNISTNKIRFYEKKGLLSPVRDKENNYRDFKEEDILRLQTILMYRVLNMPLTSIKDILENDYKDNILEHFYNQWQIVNDEIHKMKLIKDSLEKIMDSIYDSKDEKYYDNILRYIKDMNRIKDITDNWKDRWDFDGWAKSYDKSVKEDKGELKIYKNYEKILNEVYKISIKNINEKSKVLEIGVGTGNLSKKFLEQRVNIIGIDQSREMLNIAKKKLPNLKLRLGEFLKIPFENKSFDVIVSTYAFHHLNNEEKIVAISEMIRVLKTKGKIIIGDLMFENQEEREKIIGNCTKEQVMEIEDEYYSDINVLKKILKKYNKGLTVTRIDELNFIIKAE